MSDYVHVTRRQPPSSHPLLRRLIRHIKRFIGYCDHPGWAIKYQFVDSNTASSYRCLLCLKTFPTLVWDLPFNFDDYDTEFQIDCMDQGAKAMR